METLICKSCGSTNIEARNGSFYCCICGTQLIATTAPISHKRQDASHSKSDAYLENADAALAGSNIEKALYWVEQALETTPNHAMACAKMAELLFLKKSAQQLPTIEHYWKMALKYASHGEHDALHKAFLDSLAKIEQMLIPKSTDKIQSSLDFRCHALFYWSRIQLDPASPLQGYLAPSSRQKQNALTKKISEYVEALFWESQQSERSQAVQAKNCLYEILDLPDHFGWLEVERLRWNTLQCYKLHTIKDTTDRLIHFTCLRYQIPLSSLGYDKALPPWNKEAEAYLKHKLNFFPENDSAIHQYEYPAKAFYQRECFCRTRTNLLSSLSAQHIFSCEPPKSSSLQERMELLYLACCRHQYPLHCFGYQSAEDKKTDSQASEYGLNLQNPKYPYTNIYSDLTRWTNEHELLLQKLLQQGNGLQHKFQKACQLAKRLQSIDKQFEQQKHILMEYHQKEYRCLTILKEKIKSLDHKLNLYGTGKYARLACKEKLEHYRKLYADLHSESDDLAQRIQAIHKIAFDDPAAGKTALEKYLAEIPQYIASLSELSRYSLCADGTCLVNGTPLTENIRLQALSLYTANKIFVIGKYLLVISLVCLGLFLFVRWLYCQDFIFLKSHSDAIALIAISAIWAALGPK